MIELPWNNPIGERQMTKYLAALGLRPGLRVLDVGCGAGEVLIRIAESCEVTGLGVDTSAPHIAEANRRAAGRHVDASLRFAVRDAALLNGSSESFDLVICLGASHAFGLGKDAYANALAKMTHLAAPGGLLMIAEGYLRQPAAPEYRQVLGDAIGDEMTHAGNVAAGESLGLIPFAAWTSSRHEWDDFEWTYQQIVERAALADPTNEAAAAKLQRRRQWIRAYLKWGRDTLGFGIYVFRTSPE